WHVARDQGEHAAGEMLGRPGRKSDTAARFEYAQHFTNRNAGAWREDMAELAKNNVERGVRVGQRLGVAFDKLHVDAANLGVFFGSFDKRRCQVEPAGLRTAKSGGNR